MRKLLIAFLFVTGISSAQLPTYQGKSSSEIVHELQKLQNTGKVLYLAAHPDDENTRFIAFLENDLKFQTAYLSLTRGDGGQNLIGPELSEQLGMLRTQELLAARDRDGGEQFFTRAVDFGYSKSAEETFDFWNKEEVLSDVVRIIRYYKPDIIVTRFPPNSRAGHGHHTASAILAEEAIEKAASRKAFKEQLQEDELGTHQVQYLFHNTSTWWYPDLPEQMETNDSIIRFDVGGYDALLGKSYNEIAALARSQHRCQGFGASLQRGEQYEYLKLVKAYADDYSNAFNPISWKENTGNAAFDELLAETIDQFNYQHPEKNIPKLLELKQALSRMAGNANARGKMAELDQIIAHCLGLHIELLGSTWFKPIHNGEELKVKIEAVSRLANIKLNQVYINNQLFPLNLDLEENQELEHELSIPSSLLSEITHPYWLKYDFKNLYRVDDKSEIYKPDGPEAAKARFVFELEGQLIEVESALMYKWTERADGELLRPLIVVPNFCLNFTESSYVFTEGKTQNIKLTVRAFEAAKGVEVSLNLPDGWTSKPSVQSLNFESANSEQQIVFELTPSKNRGIVALSAQANYDGKTYKHGIVEIQYPHIQPQVYFPEAKVSAANFDLKIEGKQLAYIQGAGDAVPKALEQMGYEVTLLTEDNIDQIDFNKFDAILAGIRAYNTQAWLKDYKQALLAYVEQGGNYIIQYNTSRGIDSEWMSPYEFKLGRGRVTDETAPVRFIDPSHKILNQPNKLDKADFDHWVQERGLYFASEWSPAFQPVLAWNDKGEEELEGALIVAAYGKGSIMYTGISFFRELPAGVPGAFRLLANLIAYQPTLRYEGK